MFDYNHLPSPVSSAASCGLVADVGLPEDGLLLADAGRPEPGRSEPGRPETGLEGGFDADGGRPADRGGVPAASGVLDAEAGRPVNTKPSAVTQDIHKHEGNWEHQSLLQRKEIFSMKVTYLSVNRY